MRTKYKVSIRPCLCLIMHLCFISFYTNSSNKGMVKFFSKFIRIWAVDKILALEWTSFLFGNRGQAVEMTGVYKFWIDAYNNYAKWLELNLI